jgi:hypothetical protein
VLIALSTKVKQILLQVVALCLLASKWLVKAIAALGPRKPSKKFLLASYSEATFCQRVAFLYIKKF